MVNGTLNHVVVDIRDGLIIVDHHTAIDQDVDCIDCGFDSSLVAQ